jgi:hypothetical protein
MYLAIFYWRDEIRNPEGLRLTNTFNPFLDPGSCAAIYQNPLKIAALGRDDAL